MKPVQYGIIVPSPSYNPYKLIGLNVSMNDEFDALVNDVFYTFLEHRPDLGTALGLHQYDTDLPSGTQDFHLQYIQMIADFREKFREFEGEKLSPERNIDWKLMISILNIHYFNENTLRLWEKDPDISEMIGFAILPLFVREFSPLEDRINSITSRMEKFPQIIENFKQKIKNPPPLWRNMAKEPCETLPLFFQIIIKTAQKAGVDTADLSEAATCTAEHLDDYKTWLDTLECEGEPITGKEHFEELLKVRELGLSADDILSIGQEYLHNETQHLTELAHAINPSVTVEEVRDSIRSDHPPTFSDTLEEYTRALAFTRKVVSENQFASIPKGERLKVEETPVFLRYIIPVAAYFSPAKFEKDQMGIYFVTPVEGNALGEHNHAAILNTSAHEAYPGHHLQNVCANGHPSLVRALSQAPEFSEGWAHYCEERMREYGMNDLAIQFIQTIDVIFRAVRIIVDVNLHTGRMSFEEAVSFIEAKTGIDHQVAVAEVKRYTKTPSYPLSYLLGKHLLLQLQQDVKAHMRERYSEKAFHDVLLQGGTIPFSFVREELRLRGML